LPVFSHVFQILFIDPEDNLLINTQPWLLGNKC
jgi:hypothetical protein